MYIYILVCRYIELYTCVYTPQQRGYRVAPHDKVEQWVFVLVYAYVR